MEKRPGLRRTARAAVALPSSSAQQLCYRARGPPCAGVRAAWAVEEMARSAAARTLGLELASGQRGDGGVVERQRGGVGGSEELCQILRSSARVRLEVRANVGATLACGCGYGCGNGFIVPALCPHSVQVFCQLVLPPHRTHHTGPRWVCIIMWRPGEGSRSSGDRANYRSQSRRDRTMARAAALRQAASQPAPGGDEGPG